MEPEATSTEMDEEESSVSLPFPKTRWGRGLYGLFVIVLPVFSFSALEPLKPEWQSGRVSDYTILFLFPQASLLFFPLLAYSIICYLLLLFRPTHFAKSFLVRLGIYTGVLLALQYSILVLLYALDSTIYIIALVWIFPLIWTLIYRWAVARWTAEKVNRALLFLVSAAVVTATSLTKGSAAFLLVVMLVMAGPFWCFLLALRAVLWLFKNYETRLILSRGLGLTAWFAAYGVALRFDILKMVELYHTLPTTPPPDCYIATAAARGHPQFVHSWSVQRSDGRIMQVNKQLQRLKCGELALLAVNPHLHRLLRRIYDRVGKDLAESIQHAYLADLAYLLLKPWEWLVGFLLKILIPEIDSISKKIYMPH